MKLVVHCRKNGYDEYIGRGGPWGNPFSHLENSTAQFKVATVEEAVAKHAEWFYAQPDLVAKAKLELKGKVLGCFCRPDEGFLGRHLCHGQTLAAVANDLKPTDFE